MAVDETGCYVCGGLGGTDSRNKTPAAHRATRTARFVSPCGVGTATAAVALELVNLELSSGMEVARTEGGKGRGRGREGGLVSCTQSRGTVAGATRRTWARHGGTWRCEQSRECILTRATSPIRHEWLAARASRGRPGRHRGTWGGPRVYGRGVSRRRGASLACGRASP